jgi:site-specific recombinase XerD
LERRFIELSFIAEYIRLHGKGNKERMLPMGEEAKTKI